MKKLILTTVCAMMLVGCTGNNVEFVRAGAEARWKELGYEIIASHGYEWRLQLSPTRGGAFVWYELKQIPDNGRRYRGQLYRWGNELHVYGPEVVKNY